MDDGNTSSFSEECPANNLCLATCCLLAEDLVTSYHWRMMVHAFPSQAGLLQANPLRSWNVLHMKLEAIQATFHETSVFSQMLDGLLSVPPVFGRVLVNVMWCFVMRLNFAASFILFGKSRSTWVLLLVKETLISSCLRPCEPRDLSTSCSYQ